MKGQNEDFPLAIKVSFSKLIDKHKEIAKTNSSYLKNRSNDVVDLAKDYPALVEGMTTLEEVKKHKDQINYLLEDIFPSVLETNEIKLATIPYTNYVFKTSKRYDSITSHVDSNFSLEFSNFSDDEMYIMGCSIILSTYYGYNVDFKRTFYYKVPGEDGLERSYRGLYNADFAEIEKTDKAIDITSEDIETLIDNFDNVNVWKEKFPPQSWIFKGFVIANLYDATLDVSISNFKTKLLSLGSRDDDFKEEFSNVFKGIFNLPNIEMGFTAYDYEEGVLEQVVLRNKAKSYILNGLEEMSCEGIFCNFSMDHLIKHQKMLCVSSIERQIKRDPKNFLFQSLYKQGFKSAIITPLVIDGDVHGFFELVSPNEYELNSINANKLIDIMPYLLDTAKQSKEETENEIELLIQQECTTIHQSVHWKFKKEADRVIRAKYKEEEASFNEIVFNDVYPLYGQIDIKGSSKARNDATVKDLHNQLTAVNKVLEGIYKKEKLPIYEQLSFRITSFLNDIDTLLHVDSEKQVIDFLKREINPLFNHLKEKDKYYKELVDDYAKMVDQEKGFVYHYRKNYDVAVTNINKQMARLLDEKQKSAQEMFPHYYERFKTDGVEHNLYIGESISKKGGFNKVYLYNLRLWQMQVMCEMENGYYQIKNNNHYNIEVASMILVFNNPLSLRFRMDEKRFDVDGTYNARYEVVKKRVDKAKIKGTDERITQAGKITIVYAQQSDEQEYLKYISFLQHKKLLGTDVEIFTLEDLQGVTGLKAIRVNVLYKKTNTDKTYYTYQDLLEEIKS